MQNGIQFGSFCKRCHKNHLCQRCGKNAYTYDEHNPDEQLCTVCQSTKESWCKCPGCGEGPTKHVGIHADGIKCVRARSRMKGAFGMCLICLRTWKCSTCGISVGQAKYLPVSDKCSKCELNLSSFFEACGACETCTHDRFAIPIRPASSRCLCTDVTCIVHAGRNHCDGQIEPRYCYVGEHDPNFCMDCNKYQFGWRRENSRESWCRCWSRRIGGCGNCLPSKRLAGEWEKNEGQPACSGRSVANIKTAYCWGCLRLRLIEHAFERQQSVFFVRSTGNSIITRRLDELGQDIRSLSQDQRRMLYDELHGANALGNDEKDVYETPFYVFFKDVVTGLSMTLDTLFNVCNHKLRREPAVHVFYWSFSGFVVCGSTLRTVLIHFVDEDQSVQSSRVCWNVGASSGDESILMEACWYYLGNRSSTRCHLHAYENVCRLSVNGVVWKELDCSIQGTADAFLMFFFPDFSLSVCLNI